MLRKSGLIIASAVLLWGCDLFSTREFRSKPSEIRALSGLLRSGDSVSFLSTESIWITGGITGGKTSGKTDAAQPEKILSARRLVFIFEGDSLDGADTLKRLTLRIRDDSSGAILETDRRLVRFSSQGVTLESAALGGGARYFPLKASTTPAAAGAAPAALPDSAPASALSELSELSTPSELFALPALLVEGWAETRAMGVLTVTRRQTSIDTLPYAGRLEETWVIRETVGDGTAPLSRGDYWYGATGLLRVEQTWDGFGWRSENGAVPVKAADGGPAATGLRRVVVRL